MSRTTALLAIDVQVGVVELIPDALRRQVLANIGALISKARISGAPVIYIQHDGAEGHPLQVDSPGWQIHPAVRPAEGEVIIRKRASDSFFQTKLQQELEARGITHLVVTGGMTQYCVDTTCRRATSEGYDVTLVSDAHLAADTKLLTAAEVISHHNALLDGFGAGAHLVSATPANKVTF